MLNQLELDVKASQKAGDFSSKKAIFSNRFNAIRAVFASHWTQNLYQQPEWESGKAKLFRRDSCKNKGRV